MLPHQPARNVEAFPSGCNVNEVETHFRGLENEISVPILGCGRLLSDEWDVAVGHDY